MCYFFSSMKKQEFENNKFTHFLSYSQVMTIWRVVNKGGEEVDNNHD